MSKVLVEESNLTAIASAIRQKLGVQTTYKPSQMAAAIQSIAPQPSLETKSIVANGIYTPSTGKDGFSQVTVNVPNTYAAGDEGKVVSSGALVAQTARASEITANGTYDTTENNSVTVNVSGGGGGNSNVTVSKNSPTNANGHIGDIWVQFSDYTDISTSLRTYTLTILTALRGSGSLSYAGASDLDIIFDDGNGNEVSMRELSDFSYSASGGQISYAFDNSESYWESNPTPIWAKMMATIPTNYTFKKLKVMQRTGSYETDVWQSFTLTEQADLFNNTIISESGLTVSDWAGAGNYTYFTQTEQIPRYSISHTFIKVGTTEQTAEWVEPANINVTISNE